MADATWSQQPPAPTADNPMLIHVKVIAILELVWGALAALGAVVVLLMFALASFLTKDAGAPGFVPRIIASFGILFVIVLAGLAVVGIVGGLRLLKLRRSGKVFTYISAALSLFSFPLGTAFGVYAFVILTRPDTDRLLVNP